MIRQFFETLGYEAEMNGRLFDRILGRDISWRSLEVARKRLPIDEMEPRQRQRIELIHGALTYEDPRLSGFDTAVLVEVIEHLDTIAVPSPGLIYWYFTN